MLWKAFVAFALVLGRFSVPCLDASRVTYSPPRGSGSLTGAGLPEESWSEHQSGKHMPYNWWINVINMVTPEPMRMMHVIGLSAPPLDGSTDDFLPSHGKGTLIGALLYKGPGGNVALSWRSCIASLMTHEPVQMMVAAVKGWFQLIELLVPEAGFKVDCNTIFMTFLIFFLLTHPSVLTKIPRNLWSITCRLLPAGVISKDIGPGNKSGKTDATVSKPAAVPKTTKSKCGNCGLSTCVRCESFIKRAIARKKAKAINRVKREEEDAIARANRPPGHCGNCGTCQRCKSLQRRKTHLLKKKELLRQEKIEQEAAKSLAE